MSCSTVGAAPAQRQAAHGDERMPRPSCGAVGRRRVESSRTSASESARSEPECVDRCPIAWIRRRLECGAQLGGRQRQRIEREARAPQAQRGQRGRRQPDAHRVQLVGATAQHLVDRAVGDEPALLVEHDDAIDEADGRVEIVLDEQDRAVAVRDQLGERRVDLFDALRIEVRGRLVQHEQRRTHRERARDRESLPSAARQAVGVLGAALPQPDAAQRGLGARRAPRPPASAGSRVRTRPRRAACRSPAARRGPGRPCRRACSARRPWSSARRGRRPRSCPRTSAGTACGIRPFSARVSVDLPDPLGPSSSTTSPGAMSKLTTDGGAGVARPSWVIARSRTRSSGSRRGGAGSTPAGRCAEAEGSRSSAVTGLPRRSELSLS